MSGEFGSYTSGYFWSQIEQGAQDCRQGDDELTRLWGAFLEEFAPIAQAISWSEAGDSGPHSSIIETIQRMPELRRRLSDIENYVAVFKRVADEAVRRKLSEDES